MERQEKNKGNAVDVLLANDAIHVQDWLIEGAYGPDHPVNDDDDGAEMDTPEVQTMHDEEMEATGHLRRSVRVRELYEDDFKSDSDEEGNVEEEDIEYEEDDNEVGVDPLEDIGEEDTV